MVKYAVVGTSLITQEFIAAAAGTGLVLAGVCSRSAERGAAFTAALNRPDLRVYVGIDALTSQDEIAAVYIASPNVCHYAQCDRMLRAGKHVLCEKPLAVSSKELMALQTLALQCGLVLMEAIMYLHTPMRRAALEALPRLGRITGVQIDFSQRSSRFDRLLAGELPNIFNETLCAGAFNDLGVYCVYPLLDFFGEPEALLTARLRQNYPGAADTSGTALLRYPDFDAVLTWSKTGQSCGVSQIIGERGTLCIRSISQFQGVAFNAQDGTVTVLDSPLTKPEVMRYEAQAFYQLCCGEGAISQVTYGEASALALRVASWMELIRKGSAQCNQAK